MSATEFALNAPLAVQRWSTSLSVETAKNSYFAPFIGSTPDSLLVYKDELQKGAGEKITVGLRMKLAAEGIEGDNTIEGSATGEEALVFFNDSLFIDQLRKGTKSKGRMSEQRVPYSMRKEGRDALAVWWAEEYDELIIYYLSGARGIATAGLHRATSFTGRANNTLQAPDAAHLSWGGVATSRATLTNTDKMSLASVERLVASSELTDPMIQPFRVNGQKKFVLLMHTIQAYQMRTGTSENDWLAIHKATDAGEASGSMIYKNALGEYADVVLHKHRNVVTFSDGGSGGTLTYGRALFMGAQAGIVAHGQDGGPGRYTWNEETDDRGNALAITAGAIFGVKKARYNSKDFGVFAHDCYMPLSI